MKRLMEYKIISGRVIEIRRSVMSVREVGEARPRRAPRVAGNTSEKKEKANELSSARNLARVINCNYGAGDVHCVLKYIQELLPVDYEAAEAFLKKVLDKYRREFRKRYNRSPKVIWVTGNWSPMKKKPARLHHHVIVEKDGAELLHSLWTGGGWSQEDLDNRGDHSDLAAYLCENVQGRPAKNRWHCSRGMDRPIYTEPEPVEDVEDIHEVKGTVIKEHEVIYDEDGIAVSSYIRCLSQVAPKVRGGKIVMPRKDKKGGRMRW